MGVDLSIGEIPCKECGHQTECEEFYCTYNLSPMWFRIYPESDHLIDIEGLTGNEAKPRLEYALRTLQKDSKFFMRLNPPNGFGSYEGFMKLIKNLIMACIKYPDSVWQAWR